MTLPKTATAIKQLAEENGWSVAVAQPDERTALGFERDGTQVTAYWNDGRFTAAVVHHPQMKLIQRDLKDLLSTPVEEFGFDDWPPKLDDDPKQNMKWEYEMCGAYISGHPLDHVNLGAYPDVVDIQTVDEARYWDGRSVQVLGIVEETKVVKSRRGYWLAFFTVSDLSGAIECMGFGEDYKHMATGSLVHIIGETEERNGGLQIKALNTEEVDW